MDESEEQNLKIGLAYCQVQNLWTEGEKSFFRVEVIKNTDR